MNLIGGLVHEYGERESKKIDEMFKRNVPEWKIKLLVRFPRINQVFGYSVWSQPNYDGKPGEFVILEKHGKFVDRVLTGVY